VIGKPAESKSLPLIVCVGANVPGIVPDNRTGEPIVTSARYAEVFSSPLVMNMKGLSCCGSWRSTDDAAPLATNAVTARRLNAQIAGRRNHFKSKR
jgi:hypothetical protein